MSIMRKLASMYTVALAALHGLGRRPNVVGMANVHTGKGQGETKKVNKVKGTSLCFNWHKVGNNAGRNKPHQSARERARRRLQGHVHMCYVKNFTRASDLALVYPSRLEVCNG